MPRIPNAVPPHELYITMPQSLYERMERLLRSDLTGTIPYGARSDLIVSLLTNYLDIVEGIVE
jgi:hypothetical protein